jgi:polysaccharide biosynthesis protein PslH
MRVLFLTTILLSRNRNGGEVASQCFIDALKHNGHQVTVAGYLRKGDAFEHDPQEVLIVDQRYTETSKSKFYSCLWFVLSLLTGLPYSSTKYYSRAYIRLVKNLLESEVFDLVVIDHAQLSWLVRWIGQKHKIITIAHNVEYQIYQEIFKNSSHPISKWIYQREANLIQQHETRLAATAKQIWTLTDHDAEYFSNIQDVNVVKVFALPPGSEKLKNEPICKTFDIALLGSWAWKANQEALEWFLKAVYPLLPTDLSIYIAGKGADWLVGRYPNVHYKGVVPDAQEFMAQANVVAIPTLSGGGIQIKTLDAIASSSLVVATPIALRGISNPPQTVQLAEQPEEFAQALIAASRSVFVQQAFYEARNWYHARRDQFLQDIDKAIHQL